MKKLLGDRERLERLVAVLAAVVVSLGAFMGFSALSGFSGLAGFEAGKVADRDVIAEFDAVYVDDQATRTRADAEMRLVPAVFVIDDSASRASLEALAAFGKAFVELAASRVSKDELALRARGLYPDLEASDIPARLADYPVPANAVAQGRAVLEALQRRGILAIPDTGLEHYNPETIELRRWTDGPLVYEQLPLEKALTARRLKAAAHDVARSMKLSATTAGLAADLAAAFAAENAFFDEAQSKRRLDAAAARVEPVMRRVAKGEYVIRKGFIVTSEDLKRLAAVRGGGARFDAMYALWGSVLLVIMTAGSLSLLGSVDTGVRLRRPDFFFCLGLGAAFFMVSVGVLALVPSALAPHAAAFLPMALVAMLVAILIGERFALLYAVALSVMLLVATEFDALAPFQALVSALAGILLVRKADKRIDLVRAGAQLALVQMAVGVAVAALVDRGFLGSLASGFWSAVNGFLCGVLTLAFLPILEQALNAPTVFRLQELSDLNAPALKRLLSVAPGTYSHSVTVAHLAESACREIGADALLARVGAYYHDIGKIEKPEYFIENQSGYNKHDDINPSLSATVLRGHVKFGLERAEALRLPESVKAVIAEHHGTSLISYFFAQAKKDDVETSTEDYRYPGPLPSSREAAVVMLADCVEAASRTLKHPNLGKLEQYVKDLVQEKYDSGQLSRSSLTFRDLELIRNSFVRVLAGHFHSRIEYPKAKEAR